MKVKMNMMALILLVIVFGGITISMMTGVWSTKNDRYSFNASKDDITETIKGNTTFGDLLELGITQEEIEEVLDDNLPPLNQTLKAYCNEKNLEYSEIKNRFMQLLE